VTSHLSSEAHQIIGDRQYGKSRINNMARDLYGLQRLFLHSYRLEFIHPTENYRVTLRDPLPEDLVTFLRKLPEFQEEYIRDLI
jgi:23S rRNA pseudouridine955/2504/2580 synthase